MDDRPLLLVTGAAGGLGRELVPRLRAGGFRVRSLDLPTPGGAADGECDEVLVGFEFADPRRPYVVAGLYNPNDAERPDLVVLDPDIPGPDGGMGGGMGVARAMLAENAAARRSSRTTPTPTRSAATCSSTRRPPTASRRSSSS